MISRLGSVKDLNNHVDHRMRGLRGNPRDGTIVEIIKILLTNGRVRLRAEAHKAAA